MMKKVLLFLAPLATAGAEAFAEYLVSAHGLVTKEVLVHAALAAAVVDLTLLKTMVAPKAAQ